MIPDRTRELARFQLERANGPLTAMTIKSRVQSKWRFVDLETGDIWKWKNGKFIADRSHRIQIRQEVTT